MKKIVSIIIPAFNERENIAPICSKVGEIFAGLPEYSPEIIFVDDGSSDGSNEIFKRIASSEGRVKILQFSRNFGKEIAISAGLAEASGDAAIVMDADFEHPPELIPEFLEVWKSGAEVVEGVRKKTAGGNFFRNFFSGIFCRIMNAIGDTKMILGSTDFRLLDKKVIQEFNKFTERNRISRGLIDWLGFEKKYVEFDAPKRRNGRSRYSKIKLFRLAVLSFVSHSLFPLQFAGYLGAVITFLSGALGIFIIVEKFILGDPLKLNFSGPASLAVLNVFLVGLVLVCLGLISLYVGNIHGEVVNRPMYVLKKKINFDSENGSEKR